jgi:hypothetical protein
MNSRGRVNSTVMWHRYLTNGLAAAQYLSYLCVGALYFLYFAILAGFSAGFSWWALAFLFLPLLLAGYGSGLALLMPRIAAIAAIIATLPFLILGISDFFRGSIQADPLFVIPSAVVIAISIVVLLWAQESVWSRQGDRTGRVLIGLVAAVPAALATYELGAIIWWLSGFRRAT